MCIISIPHLIQPAILVDCKPSLDPTDLDTQTVGGLKSDDINFIFRPIVVSLYKGERVKDGVQSTSEPLIGALSLGNFLFIFCNCVLLPACNEEK